MLASERLAMIVKIVDDRGFVSTKTLSELLRVTETTIRRDSENLEKTNQLLRVHGGVKSINKKSVISALSEKKMIERTENRTNKELVSQQAASLVEDGDCIFLDGGTSVVPMIKYLKGKKIKIVTHSTLIVNAFDDSESELFVLGGKYIPEYNMNVGPIAISDLEKFNFDISFIGCAGIDIDKEIVYAAEMDTAAVKLKAMSLADRSFLLIDYSKWNIKGFNTFVESSIFDGVISNRNEEVSDEDIPDNFIIV